MQFCITWIAVGGEEETSLWRFLKKNAEQDEFEAHYTVFYKKKKKVNQDFYW